MEANRQPTVVDVEKPCGASCQESPHGSFCNSVTQTLALATRSLAAILTICGCSAFATAPADLQPGDSNVEPFLTGDLGFQAFEQRAGDFLDPSTFEAGEMNMIDVGFRFVEMLLAIQMHQVEFINQPQLLEKVERSIYRRPVDLAVSLLRQRQQRRGIQVTIRLLDRLDQYPPLAGNAHAPETQLLKQRPSIQSLWFHLATSCDSVASGPEALLERLCN
jgi:hypothetical protein